MNPEKVEVWRYSLKQYRELESVGLASAKKSAAVGDHVSADAFKAEALRCRIQAEKYAKDLRDAGHRI